MCFACPACGCVLWITLYFAAARNVRWLPVYAAATRGGVGGGAAGRCGRQQTAAEPKRSEGYSVCAVADDGMPRRATARRRLDRGGSVE